MTIELLCAGRLGVDLYAEQDGAPLRDVESFARYLGGSAANICVGTARLGLRSAMCSRVGEEELGDFLLATLEREGVDCSLVQVDSQRPSGMVVLALRPSQDFPRVFYYRDSADLATDPTAIDLQLVRDAEALLLTGSFLTTDMLVELSRLLATAVRGGGGRVVLDLDYRPVLFGVVPVGLGNEMTRATESVSTPYRLLLPYCHLVVGTEAEFLAAAGSGDLAEALRVVRRVTEATLVVKQGPRGAIVYEDEIPVDLTTGTSAPGFHVRVRNTVGAGDGFLSGFLSGWLRGLAIEECLRRGNAAGAIVATRAGCTPAMPFAAELERFLALGGLERPDDDPEIARLHRLGSRPPTPDPLCVLAIDHRWQLEELADESGVARSMIAELKQLLGEAFFAVARETDGTGILVDAGYGAGVLERAAGSGVVVMRTTEVARSRPVELVCGEELAAELHRWPAGTVAKVNVYCHPSDAPELRAVQLATLARMTRACRDAGRELLVELQPPGGASYGPGDLAALLAECYAVGVTPEWWKLPPSPAEVWHHLGELVRREDPSCRGLLVLGSTSSPEQLELAFAAAASEESCRGFAVGRALFADAAAEWFRGRCSDEQLVEEVATRYAAAIVSWSQARAAVSPACEEPERAGQKRDEGGGR